MFMVEMTTSKQVFSNHSSFVYVYIIYVFVYSSTH